uniref:Endonuclease n=1 Tax=Meloidogyne incognita TaxID=6306 RepID=A0A914M0Z9_MELIC
MNKTTFYASILASSAGAASLGFISGNYCSSNESKNDFWRRWRVFADSAGTAVALPPQATPLPSGPVEMKQPQKSNMVNEFRKGPSRAAEIMRFGYPGFDNLRTYEDFIVSYDRRNRVAHWVIEHLTKDVIAYNPDVDRSKCIFKPDTSIHPYFQSQNEDYKRSGYDRGHLAAAANHRSTQLTMEQTFFLTNMTPQVGKGFNRDKWNDLEKHVRNIARESLNVYVCSGPLYLPYQEEDGHFYIKYKVIGANRVAVPTHFFKVVLIEKIRDQFELEVYLMPNAPIPNEKLLSEFFSPLDAIERAAGFLIFDKLPKEQLKKLNGKKLSEVKGGIFECLDNFVKLF